MRDMRERSCEMGDKFRRWVRNFDDEASEGIEQMEKQRRKRENRTEKMRGMREKFRVK